MWKAFMRRIYFIKEKVGIFPKGHGSFCRLTDNDPWNVMREEGKKTFLARLIMYARVCHAQRGMCSTTTQSNGNISCQGKGLESVLKESVLKMSVTRTFSNKKAGSWMKILV